MPTSWTGRPSTTTTWGQRNPGQFPDGYLLKEDGFKLLQESGFGILLDNGYYLTSNWWPRTAALTSTWNPRVTP